MRPFDLIKVLAFIFFTTEDKNFISLTMTEKRQASVERDQSPKRTASWDNYHFKKFLQSNTNFADLPSKKFGRHRFQITGESVWDTYKEAYAAYPWKEDNYQAWQTQHIFEILVNALLFRNHEKLALDIVQRNQIKPRKILAGLFANGSLRFYNKTMANSSEEEIKRTEEKIGKRFPVPLFSMELFLHFKCWQTNIDFWINLYGRNVELLELVFNVWNCFQIKSEVYCQFLIDKINERTTDGNFAYALAFAESARGKGRRWMYTMAEANKWDHPKALELCELINFHIKNLA